MGNMEAPWTWGWAACFAFVADRQETQSSKIIRKRVFFWRRPKCASCLTPVGRLLLLILALDDVLENELLPLVDGMLLFVDAVVVSLRRGPVHFGVIVPAKHTITRCS